MIDKQFWEGKKVFITGHTGFKGSWLSVWLSSLGSKITGYALEPPTNPSLFGKLRLNELLDHNLGDIRDLENLTKVMTIANPDIVIHMAAQPLVRESYLDPVGTYQTNVMGTVNVLEAARKCKSIRAIINVTTDKCYENKEWIWSYRENEPMGGYDPYSNSKGCSELITSSYRNSFFNQGKYGLDHQVALASVRAGNVIGGGDWAKDRLIPDIIKSFQNKESVLIRSPYAIRPWQHVLEPLSGYLTLAELLYVENGIEFAEGWNLGPNDSDAKSVEWIVEKMCGFWGKDSSYRIDENPHPHEASYLKLDNSKAKSRLGWSPNLNLLETLKLITDFYISGEINLSKLFKEIESYSKKMRGEL